MFSRQVGKRVNVFTIMSVAPECRALLHMSQGEQRSRRRKERFRLQLRNGAQSPGVSCWELQKVT